MRAAIVTKVAGMAELVWELDDILTYYEIYDEAVQRLLVVRNALATDRVAQVVMGEPEFGEPER